MERVGGSLPILEHEQVMRCSESLQPIRKSPLEFFERVHRASGLRGDRLDHGEQVFGAMSEFAHKEFDMLLCDLAVGHIGHDVDQASSFAIGVPGNDLATPRQPSDRSIRSMNSIFNRVPILLVR